MIVVLTGSLILVVALEKYIWLYTGDTLVMPEAEKYSVMWGCARIELTVLCKFSNSESRHCNMDMGRPFTFPVLSFLGYSKKYFSESVSNDFELVFSEYLYISRI